MVRHVVMWKFKEEAEGKSKEENMNAVKNGLLALPALIPQLKKAEVYFDVSHTDMSMDLMLVTEHDTLEDMRAYAEHPEHLKVSAYVRRVIERRVVLDSEL